MGLGRGRGWATGFGHPLRIARIKISSSSLTVTIDDCYAPGAIWGRLGCRSPEPTGQRKWGLNMTAATATSPPRITTSRLALIAVGGVVLYLLIDVLLAFLRPDLSLLHRAESDYGVGPYSWLMDLNFLLRGALSLALAAALLRVAAGSNRLRVGVAFLAVWGVGSGILAFFPDDPPGYPVTAAGQVHLAVAFIAFLSAVIGTIVLSVEGRHFAQLRPLHPWLLVVSVAAVIPLALLGHTQFRPHTLAGLYERAFLALELLWILIVGLRLRQTSGIDPGATTDRP